MSAICSLAQVGRALDVSGTAVEHWADPEHDAAVTLGDVLAMPSGAAEALLVGALAIVQAKRLQRAERLAPAARVLRLVSASASVAARGAEAATDGAIDEGERRDLLGLLEGVEREVAATRRDLAVGA